LIAGRLVDGIASASFGVHCAQLAGVKESVLRRAVQIIKLQAQRAPIGRMMDDSVQQRDELYTGVLSQLAALSAQDRVATAAFLQQSAALEV
jgi:DNA mismatch repair protein MSH5